ncbi:FUSC family protein [Niveibacterium sp. SC-1]|uniref:FUSC family protein n=1 Tax=Niveibacterium sp. SC-1 TaxID=3135646 RepID=UPI00311EF0BF
MQRPVLPIPGPFPPPRWRVWLHAHGLQVARTLVATLLAFGASRALGLPEPHWAVISVLIVVRPELDGIDAGRQRLLGTLVGSLLGMAIAWARHHGMPDWLALATVLGGLAPLAASLDAFRAAPMAAVIISSAGGSALGVGLLRLAEIALGIGAGLMTRLLFQKLGPKSFDARRLAPFVRGLASLVGGRIGVEPMPTQALRDTLRKDLREIGRQGRERAPDTPAARIAALAAELYTAVQFLPPLEPEQPRETTLHAAAAAVHQCLREADAAWQTHRAFSAGHLREARGALDRAAEAARTRQDDPAPLERNLATVFALRRVLRALNGLRELHPAPPKQPPGAAQSG